MHKSLLISTVLAIVLMNGTVLADDTTVNTWEALKEAVENGSGGTIVLGSDIEMPEGEAITKYVSGTVIDGNGHTISAPVSPEGTTSASFRFIRNSTTVAEGETPLEIKNVTFNGGHVISSFFTESGAIYNYNGTIGDIHGNFEGNYAKGSSSVYGGAIYNQADYLNATIGDIYGNFEGNYAESSYQASGGAIYNQAYHSNATIGDIYGNFTGNYAKGATFAEGGAIYNSGTIGDIYGNFEGNYAEEGGAIYNIGTIGNIHSNFTGNYTKGTSARGGAIRTSFNSTIGDIHGNFEGNYAEALSQDAGGGAIDLRYSSSILNINGDFINNHASSGGNGNVQGGAITSSIIPNKNHYLHGNFKNNYVSSAGGTAQGGALAIAFADIVNSSFINNHASGKIKDYISDGYSHNPDTKTVGGAIYSKNLNLIAQDNYQSVFRENYLELDGTKTPNAIYMEGPLSLITKTGGSFIFDDEIDGTELEWFMHNFQGEIVYELLDSYNYELLISGDGTGNIFFNNIRNADITLDNTNVTLGNAAYISDNNSLTINSGKFNVASLGMDDVLTANSITVNGGELNIVNADVDLAEAKMGQIDGSVLSVSGGKINVEKLLLTSDSEKEATNVLFIKDTKGVKVSHNDKTAQKAVAPVYKYDVSFNAATGEFIFTRTSASDVNDPEPEGLNQGVFASDVFMMSSLDMQDDATKKVISVTPKLDYTQGRVWAMPFYSDDTVEYKNFYDVDSRNYGLIAGVDTRAFGTDTNFVYTLFGAYNEGKDKYEGIKVENKSWLLGLKASVFSDNGLYGDAIVDIASHDMDAKTFYGSDSHDTYGYGAALKGGYKHDIEKVNIDTSVMLSWQQIKGDDFTAKSGAKMKTDDYSRLSLMPQVKVGYRALKYWTPYALVRYNFVLDEDGSSVANDTTLPEIESKDYVEYGLGVETATNSSHSGFAHVLRHDGGREGWSITAGYRYNF